MNKDSKIYIAGHRGLVGSAIHRKLTAEGYTNLIYRTSKELDLRDQKSTIEFFKEEQPEYVFFVAARAGGVLALQNYKADYLIDNLLIQANIIGCSHTFGVNKLLFMGSNCMYPKLVTEPFKEEYILSGKLEPTTEFYAIAKIAGMKLCQAYRDQFGCNFITAIPVNLYGPNDKQDLEVGHVMPALLRKFKESDGTVEVWGTGNARREFMHVDDLADACLFLMLNYNELEPINVGSGQDISIKALAEAIATIVSYRGKILFDASKPDGIRGKLLDSTKINNLGWKPKIRLNDGIKQVYDSL